MALRWTLKDNYNKTSDYRPACMRRWVYFYLLVSGKFLFCLCFELLRLQPLTLLMDLAKLGTPLIISKLCYARCECK